MKNFIKGIRLGVPIGLGYLSVSFTFGILAVSYGFKWWQAVVISMTTLTSAGQLAAIGVMLTPGNYIEMLVSQLTINIRYSFMSVSLSQKTSAEFCGIKRWLLGFFMTDEIFAVASGKGDSVGLPYLLGLALTPYLGWSTGTLIGALAGSALPPLVTSALGVAIYGMFIAIVVPKAKESRPTALCVLFAIALSCAFEYLPYLKEVSDGFVIIICAVLASALFALLFPIKEESEVAENE